MHSGERWTLGHQPALDGLRGVAIGLVLLSHVLQFAWMPNSFHALGAAGVSLFFALSGFLITALLLEQSSRGPISLRRFYRNRALRLAPALVVAVAVIGTLDALIWSGSAKALVYVATYSANWAVMTGHRLYVLQPMWSLAVEEQFYLVWPLVVVALVHRRNWLLYVTAAGIVASLVARFTSTGLHTYYGSDTQAASLLVGCMLAVLATRGLSAKLARPWMIPAGVAVLVSAALVHGTRFGDLWAPALAPFVGAVLIWAVCSTPAGILSNPVLRYLGQRSYALYLWHVAVLFFTMQLLVPGWLGAGLGLSVLFAIAELSWRFVEQPFLRRKRRPVASDGRSQHLVAQPA